MMPERDHGVVCEAAAVLSNLVHNPSDATIMDTLAALFAERHPEVADMGVLSLWESIDRVRKLMEVES